MPKTFHERIGQIEAKLKREIEVNKNFICPISLEIMEDPITILGHTFDRNSLLQCFGTNLTLIRHPITREKITKYQVIYKRRNISIYNLIAEYVLALENETGIDSQTQIEEEQKGYESDIDIHDNDSKENEVIALQTEEVEVDVQVPSAEHIVIEVFEENRLHANFWQTFRNTTREWLNNIVKYSLLFVNSESFWASFIMGFSCLLTISAASVGAVLYNFGAKGFIASDIVINLMFGCIEGAVFLYPSLLVLAGCLTLSLYAFKKCTGIYNDNNDEPLTYNIYSMLTALIDGSNVLSTRMISGNQSVNVNFKSIPGLICVDILTLSVTLTLIGIADPLRLNTAYEPPMTISEYIISSLIGGLIFYAFASCCLKTNTSLNNQRIDIETMEESTGTALVGAAVFSVFFCFSRATFEIRENIQELETINRNRFFNNSPVSNEGSEVVAFRTP